MEVWMESKKGRWSAYDRHSSFSLSGVQTKDSWSVRSVISADLYEWWDPTDAEDTPHFNKMWPEG